MSNKYNIPKELEDEISLVDLWSAIWKNKLFILIFTIVFSILATLFSLSKPDLYKASALLSPVASQNSSTGLAGLAGQFGGLANMAGINLSSTGDNKTITALAVLESRHFIESFITNHKLLVPLIATENWEPGTNKLIYNKKLYDKENNKWLNKKPSLWEAYEEFKERLSITQDKNTSLITLSFEFYSPQLAKEWLNLLIKDLDFFIRTQNKNETEASINYLNEKIQSIKIKNMETIFYQLIEEQTKNMMLAQVKKEYVFKAIEPAQVPDDKDTPKRALIIIIGTLLGFIISISISLLLYISKNKEI